MRDTKASLPTRWPVSYVGIPTIGYGFALISNNGSVNVNTLTAVLDGLVLNGKPYVSGQVNDNVFVATSQGSSPLTQGQVLDYFSWLVKTYKNRSTSIGELQGFLTDALQQFFAGNGSTLYNNGVYLLPVEGNAQENISFAFSSTDRTNAEAVLSNLVAGATLFENSTGTGNELVISGYSPSLYQTIENEGKVDGNGDVIGAPADSAQWAALVTQYYNGLSPHASTSAGVTDGDPAQTWFVLRYDTSSATRGYLESQVFGLNGSLANSTALAYEDYEMLTEHRGKIMNFEAANGLDPNFPGDNPTIGKAVGIALGDIQAAQAQSNGPFWYPGPTGALPSALQSVGNVSDLSLFEILNPEADQIISELNSTYSPVIPQIGNASEIGDGGSFNVASTNIFVAPSQADIEAGFATPKQMDVDAAVPDPGPYGSLEAGANHIILGTGSGDVLTGGLGNDLIVASSGDETLNAGLGSDTLIGGSGNDVLKAGQGTDVLDLDFTQNPTPAFAIETIVDASGNGKLYVDGSQIGNETLTASGNLFWTDGNYQYQFIPDSQIPAGDLQGTGFGDLDWGPNVGELKITPTAPNPATAGTIDILGFNIAQAESSGFLGIKLPETASLAGGAWVDPSAVFPAGSEQAYTFSVDLPDTSAQTITITLFGASASDFEAQVGDTIEQLNSDGTFTVALSAGESSVSFGVIDVTPDNGTDDIVAGTTLTLSASVADPGDPNGSPVQSSPLSITYTPQPQDTITASVPGDAISGTLSGGVTTYQGDGGDDYISTGEGPNDILAQNSGSDSIIGGSGDNTVYGGSGNDVIDLNGSNDLVSLGDGLNTVNGSSSGQDSIYGHGGTSIINGNGGTGLIFGRNGTNQIYAGSEMGLQEAIQAANAGAATGMQGDLLTVGDGDNTGVGGSDNDLFILGRGNDVVVMGSGNSSLFRGIYSMEGVQMKHSNHRGDVRRPSFRLNAHANGQSLSLYLVLLIVLLGIPVSQAKGLAECIARNTTFDGIIPLQYASVTGKSGDRLYLHRKFPGKCAHEGGACLEKAYVLAGDPVAIGKECGNWAYVQYIGEKSTTTGWAVSSRLATIPLPPKAKLRVRHMGGHDFVARPRRYVFKMIRGTRRPVCEAYLQRLNQTPFYAPPYCGRPESKVVPGFVWLTRIPLNRQQTAALYPRLLAFKLTRHSGIPRPLHTIDAAIAASGGNGPSIFAWRYDPELDIGNDGTSRNVILWSGPPLTSDYARCGSPQLWAGRQITARWEQVAFIATQDTTALDDNLTLKIFGSPTDGLPIESRRHAPSWVGFMPIGDSFGVFKFKTLTYYDTFYAGGGWPDFYGKRVNVPSLARHLAVFLRSQGETREVCEYTYRG